jgi:hypothetical protein
MKGFIIFVAGIFLSFSAKAQSIVNTTKYNISAYAGMCCAELKIGNCLIFISESNRVLGLKGCSRQIEKGKSYSILVRKNLSFDETRLIIAHELVHIRQMKSGELEFDDQSIRYNDRIYPNKPGNHGTDEHEIEAVNLGIALHEKYKDVYYDFNGINPVN